MSIRLLKESEMKKPTIDEAMDAVKTLIRWAGDNPEREGLLETPKRVVKAFNEYFSGYDEDPAEVLKKTFEEIKGYEDVVMLRGIRFSSFCEHHMAPIIGKAYIAYLPNKRIVGISKLVRVLDIYANRLQVQETMTVDIAKTILDVLKPKGVAVAIIAEHQCMTTRGVSRHGSDTMTTSLMGAFKTDPSLKQQFFDSLALPANL